MKKEIIKKLDKAMIAYYKKLNKRCAVCGGEYSELHHWYSKRADLFLRWAPQNIMPLCHKCHMKVERNEKDWRRFFEDNNDMAFLRDGKQKGIDIIKNGFDYNTLLKMYKENYSSDYIKGWFMDLLIREELK